MQSAEENVTRSGPKGNNRQFNKEKIVHKRCKECDWILNRAEIRENKKKKRSPGTDDEPYLVEFPSDEEEGTDNSLTGMGKNEEMQLVVAVGQSLSLKRSR